MPATGYTGPHLVGAVNHKLLLKLHILQLD